MSKRSASWKTVNPPMAANAPWQSEMWPAEPGHHRDRQEHDRERDGLGHEEDPHGVAAGEQHDAAGDDERGAEQPR